MMRIKTAIFQTCILILYLALCCVAHKLRAVPFMSAKSGEDTASTSVRITTEPAKNNCICSKIYDPVCGSNDQSYYNLCQLQCDTQNGTVSVKHQGNCIPF